MNEQETIEKINEVKEFMDIKDDLEKIQNLLYDQNWNELYSHLESLHSKYPLEIRIYNLFNPYPTQNLIEYANEGIKFLQGLLKAKFSYIAINEYINK